MIDIGGMALTNSDDKDLIGEATVIRCYKWGDPVTGTVVRREGDQIFVAWHHSFVEDELNVNEVEVWADAPQALREWRGGVGVFDPAKPGQTWSVEPVSPAPPEPSL